MSYDVTFSDGTNEYGFVALATESAQSVVASRPSLSSTTPPIENILYTVRDLDDDWMLAIPSLQNGSGQASYDALNSDFNKFYESCNLDISRRGALKLGPYFLWDTTQSDIGNIAIEGLGYLWAAFKPAAAGAQEQLWFYDGTTWKATTWEGAGADPTGYVTALCCDGYYIYAAIDSADIYYGLVSGGACDMDPLVNDSSCDEVVAMCYHGGTIYVAQDFAAGTSEVGYLDDVAAPGRTFKELYMEKANPADPATPIVTHGVTSLGGTIGLVAAENYVYWGVTGGARTKVYRIQHNTVDVFEEAAELPAGFVSTCMTSYLGTVYVGGYWRYGTTAGKGAIYAIAGGSSTLLTSVGESPTSTGTGDYDHRIMGMCPYERFLYFTTKTDVWRWDLVNGGYSHYADLPAMDKVTLTLGATDDVDAGDSVTINGLTFTAHGSTTTVATRTFSIAGTDAQDADELAVCINDATYGVEGVTASSSAAVVTLTAISPYTIDATTDDTAEIVISSTTTTVTWEEFDGSSADPPTTPATWEVASSGTHVHTTTGGVLTTEASTSGGYLTETIDDTYLTGAKVLDPTVGYTIEYKTYGDANRYGHRTAVFDGTYSMALGHYRSTPGGSFYICSSVGTDIVDNFHVGGQGPFSTTTSHVVRLVCKNGMADLFVDGSLIRDHIPMYADATTNAVMFGVSYNSGSYAGERKAKWDYLKWTNCGAFPPGQESYGTSDTSSIVCLDNKTYVPVKSSWAATPAGCMVEIDPSYYNAVKIPSDDFDYNGYLTLSDSNFRMPAITKRFKSIEVSHSPLTDGQIIGCSWLLDGVGGSASDSTYETNPNGTVSTFAINGNGVAIKPTIWLGSTNLDPSGLKTVDTPTVGGVIIRYNPEGKNVHTFILDCRDRTADNSERSWDGDPATYVAFLNSACRERQVLSVSSAFDSDFDGIIEKVEYAMAPYSAHNVSPHSGIATVVVREV